MTEPPGTEPPGTEPPVTEPPVTEPPVTEPPADSTPVPAPPDPWKSFRGVMAGTLILEAIVVLLALPVVSVSRGGLSLASGGFLLGFTVVLILLAGVQGKPWALWANLVMQVVLVAGWLVHPLVGFIGVLFAAVWALIAYLRAEVKRRQDRGQLPGQQTPSVD